MTNAKRRKVLVTGGAGFLGSHLCEKLLERGDAVVCMDNYLTGAQRNITPFLHHPQFRQVIHDVCLPFHEEFDQIYNLACPASPIHYQRDPVRTVKTSVLGAIAMLDLAKSCGATILQASTSEVYGDPEMHPQKEGYWGHVNPIGPRACYDEGKRCAETLFFDYHREYGVKIKIARIFNTYGPRMQPNDGRVVSNFIVQALAGEPITIYGTGKQTRSFCYVDDLIEGLMRLMDSEEGVVGPVNLGNPQEYQIGELAEKIIALSRSSSSIVYHPLPGDDPKQRKPDISLAASLLRWSPKVELEKGLLKAIAYFAKESL